MGKLLLVSLALSACRVSPLPGEGVVDGSADLRGPDLAAPDLKPYRMSSFLLRETWGPCFQGEVCWSNLSINGAGAMTRGGAKQGQTMLSADDLARFTSVATSPAIVDGLRKGTPCEQVSDLWVTVELQLEGEPLIRRPDLQGCMVPGPRGWFAPLGAEVQRLLAKYFP